MNIITSESLEFNSIIGETSMSVAEAMRRIDVLGAGILFIINDGGILIGCITDGDIRRWLLKEGSLNDGISEIINYQPEHLSVVEENEAASFMSSKKLRAVPIVDDNKKIIRVCFNSLDSTDWIQDNASLNSIPIVIMAGGAGTRLHPYTKILPKPLIPVCDRPIIEHIIDQFKKYGALQFYAILNYKKNLIKAYFSDSDRQYDITFLDEEKYLDTGGGLALLRDYLKSTFILTNCDILIKEDFSRILDYHRSHGNTITIISSLKKMIIPYGVIEMGEEGRVARMKEKPEIPYLANTGCYIIESELLNYISDNEVIRFPDIIKRCQEKGGRVGAYPVSEYAWLDMGQFDTMEEMERRLKPRMGDHHE